MEPTPLPDEFKKVSASFARHRARVWAKLLRDHASDEGFREVFSHSFHRSGVELRGTMPDELIDSMEWCASNGKPRDLWEIGKRLAVWSGYDQLLYGHDEHPPDASSDFAIAAPPNVPPTVAPMRASVSWFAPWRWFAHWKPWKRWTLFVVVILVGYIESPVVFLPLLWEGKTSPPSVKVATSMEQSLDIVFFPLFFAADKSVMVQFFYANQIEIVAPFFRRKRGD